MRSKNRASENTIPSTFYPGQITKSNSSKRRDDTEQAFITFHPQDQDKGLFDAVGDNVTIESCGEFKAIAKRILDGEGETHWTMLLKLDFGRMASFDKGDATQLSPFMLVFDRFKNSKVTKKEAAKGVQEILTAKLGFAFQHNAEYDLIEDENEGGADKPEVFA